MSRVQPLTVTQIALIERDLRTRAHTGNYVSNFIVGAISYREMRLCARFSRVHTCITFACTRLDPPRQRSTRRRLQRNEKFEIVDSVKSKSWSSIRVLEGTIKLSLKLHLLVKRILRRCKLQWISLSYNRENRNYFFKLRTNFLILIRLFSLIDFRFNFPKTFR